MDYGGQVCEVGTYKVALLAVRVCSWMIESSNKLFHSLTIICGCSPVLMEYGCELELGTIICFLSIFKRNSEQEVPWP